MNPQNFIRLFKEAFGETAELPIVFWYSEEPVNPISKTNGCFLKTIKEVRNGATISLSADTIGCGGGKYYAGFTDLPDRIPGFVSIKEKYKNTPEAVTDFLQRLNLQKAELPWLNFSRIDQRDSFDEIEGIFFLATPDVLSGLVTWAFFDNNDDNAVSALFGSGCSSVISQTVMENRKNGKRTFLGLFDPSARPYIDADRLSYAIPMSRFKEMYDTMEKCCLFDTHAWEKIKMRINNPERKE